MTHHGRYSHLDACAESFGPTGLSCLYSAFTRRCSEDLISIERGVPDLDLHALSLGHCRPPKCLVNEDLQTSDLEIQIHLLCFFMRRFIALFV